MDSGLQGLVDRTAALGGNLVSRAGQALGACTTGRPPDWVKPAVTVGVTTNDGSYSDVANPQERQGQSPIRRPCNEGEVQGSACVDRPFQVEDRDSGGYRTDSISQ